MLPAGKHQYQFSFVFNNPALLPASFESRHGHVRYCCTAQLLLPLLARNQSIRKPFSLLSIVDLNQEAMAFVSCLGLGSG